MKSPLMNLVLMGQVKTGKGGYSIVFILALLTDYWADWLRVKDRGYGTLAEAVRVSKVDRWWLEGRSYE